MNYPKRVNIIELENAPFRCAKDAIVLCDRVGTQMPSAYAKLGETCAATTVALGMAIISARPTPQLRFAQLRHQSLDANLGVLRFRRSPRRERSTNSKRGRRSRIEERLRIAQAICVRNKDLRAKDNQPTKAYSYEISNVEVLKGNAAPVARPSDKTSTFDVCILLNGVCDVNGVPLLKT